VKPQGNVCIGVNKGLCIDLQRFSHLPRLTCHAVIRQVGFLLNEISPLPYLCALVLLRNKRASAGLNRPANARTESATSARAHSTPNARAWFDTIAALLPAAAESY
jgi:hypothetical protein